MSTETSEPGGFSDNGEQGLASRGRGRKNLRAAGAAGLTLAVVAGGAFVAYKIGVFGAPGSQPSSVVPSDAVAYAAVDFNPSAKEKLGAYELTKKFPSAHVTGKDSVKDDLLSDLLEGEDEVDYDRDIKPWIGDRAGIAALPAPGTPEGVSPLVVLSVTDQDAARSALGRLEKALTTPVNGLTGDDIDAPPVGDEFAYAFKGGYVLIGEHQHDVDAAARAQRSLDDDSGFSHDMDALGGDQLARAWVDTGALLEAVPKRAKADLPADLARMSGTVAVGAHATGDYLEVAGRTFGFTPAGDAGTTRPARLADSLPAGANVVLEATGLGRSLTNAWDDYKDADVLGLADGARQAGIKLPDDLMRMFGTDFALAVDANRETTKALLVADTPDPAASQALAGRLASAYGDLFGLRAPLSVRATDHGYAATNAPDWAEAGSLTETDAFTTAVPHAADASALLFVDIADLARQFDLTDDADTDALEAFGASASTHDGNGEFTLRLTVR